MRSYLLSYEHVVLANARVAGYERGLGTNVYRLFGHGYGTVPVPYRVTQSSS